MMMYELDGAHIVRRAHLPYLRYAEHIMAMPAVEHRWTAREVRELIASSPDYSSRYELVDGELLVTPAPAFHHQRTVRELVVSLNDYLATEHVGEVLHSPCDIELEPEFLSQPDVFVATLHEAQRVAAEGWPLRELLLAVEVLSPSSGRHDRIRKRPMYQRHVPEYWIVDLDAWHIEVWRPGDKRPELVAQRLAWRPYGASAALDLDCAALFDRVFA